MKKVVLILAIAIATLGGMIAVAFVFSLPENSSEPATLAHNRVTNFWGGMGERFFGAVSEVEQIELKMRQSYFDGKLIAEDFSEKPIIVMVENHPFARPQQSGLAEASVVREALTEGGITRFMLIFGRDYPERIGPVRSARPYFVQWASELGGIYAHAGGSEEALSEIYTSAKIINADEEVQGMSRDLAYAPPHNLFLDAQKLAQTETDNIMWSALDFNIFEFCPVTGCGYSSENLANKISVKFSTESSYDVIFNYDSENNFYIRKQNNYPNGETVTPKNVLIQYALSTPIVGDEKGRIELANIGKGRAELFVDGRHFTGMWRKDNAESRTIFYDPETLEEWRLEPGQTWIMAVDSSTQVTVE